MELRLRFRISDPKQRNGVRHIEASHPDELDKIRRALEGGDKNLSLVDVTLELEDREAKSGISEEWDIAILDSYMRQVETFGPAYFSYCETMNSRHPDGFEPPEEFNSFADAGNAVAERYFGVPEGGLKYLMATKLAKDIMNGEGPRELPESLSIFTGPDGDPVYMIDNPKEAAAPFAGMSC